MKQPSQEDLLGYVLGALDATEQKQLQEMIDNDPSLEETLVEIKNSLLPLEAIDNPAGPPVGLARRTCETVAIAAKQPAPLTPAPSKPSPPSKSWTPSFARGSWSMMDYLVTCGVILVFAAILFPALAVTRYNSRVAKCQDNLRTLGVAFLKYSEMNEGAFPSIPEGGNMSVAGCYGPILKEVSLVTDDSVFACAGRGIDREAPVCIPTVDMVKCSDCPQQTRYFQKSMGGDYGHSLGHTEDGSYRGASRLGRSHYVVLADVPSCSNSLGGSNNHSGRGQNVLFEDGRVLFNCSTAVGEDAIYENNVGLVAPGTDRYDSVVAPSWMKLVILPRSQR